MTTAKQLATQVARSLEDKRGLDIRMLDLGDMRSFTDFFVIATATSDRHAKTLCESVLQTARELGERPLGVEGQDTGRWILIDLGSVVVHVFLEETRAFYGLERLWGDAERVELPHAAGELA